VQGAAIAALLASFQRQGELLQSVDTLKCCLLFAGVMSRLEEHRPAYTQPIACPSLHVIGIAVFPARPTEAVETCQTMFLLATSAFRLWCQQDHLHVLSCIGR
jgi:Serine hydrolase (FSH1)